MTAMRQRRDGWAMGVDLYWIPLGAGGHVVAFNGRVFEALAAARARRSRCALYHAALMVDARGTRYAIELGPWSGGAAVSGPVGACWAGRLRLFRYGLRCEPGGTIPDLAWAVGGAHALTADPGAAARIVALAPRVPRLTWGRDEAGTGEMWNSNSVIAWLLASAGLPAGTLRPPAGGRAPGWAAGVELARLGRRRPGEEMGPRLGSPAPDSARFVHTVQQRRAR
jgi:hypothetical protein